MILDSTVRPQRTLNDSQRAAQARLEEIRAELIPLEDAEWEAVYAYRTDGKVCINYARAARIRVLADEASHLRLALSGMA